MCRSSHTRCCPLLESCGCWPALMGTLPPSDPPFADCPKYGNTLQSQCHCLQLETAICKRKSNQVTQRWFSGEITSVRLCSGFWFPGSLFCSYVSLKCWIFHISCNCSVTGIFQYEPPFCLRFFRASCENSKRTVIRLLFEDVKIALLSRPFAPCCIVLNDRKYLSSLPGSSMWKSSCKDDARPTVAAVKLLLSMDKWLA